MSEYKSALQDRLEKMRFALANAMTERHRAYAIWEDAAMRVNRIEREVLDAKMELAAADGEQVDGTS